MAEVTGPIRTLSGASHDVPDGQMCDDHPDRPAVARIQGETDSFGSELHDMCAECLEAERAWRKSPEAAEWRKGQCEWCKKEADDLRDARDYEEGMCGRVYRVCGACIRRQDEEARREMDYYDDYEDPPCPTCKGKGTVNPLTVGVPKDFVCVGITECPSCYGDGYL